MGKKNTYYLVGRDTNTNQFEIISFTDKRGSSLEEIDLNTVLYSNTLLFTKGLIEKGLISKPFNDYYIVHQRKYNGKTYLKTDEVLFASSTPISKLARASLDGTLKENDKTIDFIMKQFCFQMKCHPKFYQKVLSGETNIYTKFTKYFIDDKDINPYSLKYRDGCWIKESYPLLRSITDAMDTYYDMKKRNTTGREKLHNQLLEVTSEEYNPLQFSLFEGEENGREYVKK